MINASVINISNIGKRYCSYKNNTFKFLSWFGFRASYTHEFWALKNVSFKVGRGEAVAIIGRNGAGKSTLLKLITGTIRQSEGIVNLNGNVSSILELGLGFNPDFTGRQNVYLAGGLMGFSTKELENFIPYIEDFAEIGVFFDQQLRTYSSGMQARLAFSLATAIRPDVLIVDEVLSVGDAYFQHKSFARIREFKEQGTSLLIVTHSMSDVRVLCDRVVLLEKGCVIQDGEPDQVVDFYNGLIAEKENAKTNIYQQRLDNGWLMTRSGSGSAKIEKFDLCDTETGEHVNVATVGQDLFVQISVLAHEYIPRLVVGLMIKDKFGHLVWGTNSWHSNQVLANVSKNDIVNFNISFSCNLGPGSYSLTAALTSSDTHINGNFEWVDNILVFEVINTNKKTFIGSTWLDALITIEV